jgi:hypothetical protein
MQLTDGIDNVIAGKNTFIVEFLLLLFTDKNHKVATSAINKAVSIYFAGGSLAYVQQKCRNQHRTSPCLTCYSN